MYDLDSIQELMVLRSMRDEGKTWGGDALETPPQLYLGAVENPFGDPFEFRVPRLAKKVAAGADFIPTQSIYDMDRFETSWMKCAIGAWTARCTSLPGCCRSSQRR